MDKIIITTKEELKEMIEESVRKAIADTNNNPHGTIPPTLLTIEEAATFLKLSVQTLYGFTSKRTIPFIKRGKKLYFKKDALENWLNEGSKRTIDEMTSEIESNGKLKLR